MPPVPEVSVRLFAALRERAGWGECRLPLTATNGTPMALWRVLAPELQAGAELPPGVRVAVNQRFAAADIPLTAGDEVAFLPPISGG